MDKGTSEEGEEIGGRDAAYIHTYIHVCVCTHTCIYTMYVQEPAEVRRGTGCPGTGILDSCELSCGY